MPSAHFRFHGELRDLLPRGWPDSGEGPASFAERASLKDTVEAIGVPHPEIGQVRIDGAPASLGDSPPDGARVDLLPFPTPRAADGPLRFALDGHLGRLTSTLRMLGFDTWWRPQVDDRDLAELAHREHRILLTRDLGLLKRSIVSRGRFVRATRPLDQAREIVRHFGLADSARPFSRCLRCNAPLVQVDRAEIEHLLPPRVRERHTEFRRCPACGRIYWPGTHHQRMERVIASLRGD